MLSADPALVRRLETANAAIFSEMARSGPEVAVEAAAGGIAVFAGADSPMTHAIGVGMNGPVAEEDFERLENFFRSRGAACTIDLPSLADPAVMDIVRSRPYRITEVNYVMATRLTSAVEPSAGAVSVCRDAGLWASLVARAFTEPEDPPASLVQALELSSPSMVRFAASLGGGPDAGAALASSGGVSWLFGDATLPRARGRGLQRALIDGRLEYACRSGSEVAAASVLPGSSSHRNYERAGFRLVYFLLNIRREW